MWKESYRTGIERIDYQHKMLFDKSAELIAAIDRGAGPYEFQEIVSFLKGYAIFHFRDEEKYQLAVGYADHKAHKRAHEAFTEVVLGYERRLAGNSFDPAVVKELAGMLTAWLIYHVCHTDQRMVQGRSANAGAAETDSLRIIADAAGETLCAVAGLDRAALRELDAAAAPVDTGLQVGIDLVGDLNGTLVYTYNEEMALSLFERMVSRSTGANDEMVRSAMAEIANISSGSATVRMAARGTHCDIRPPRLTAHAPVSGFEGMVLESEIGRLKVSARLDRY